MSLQHNHAIRDSQWEGNSPAKLVISIDISEDFLGTLEIEKRVRFVRAAGGRKKAAILPYAVYRDLLELKTTMEVYERSEVQQSLKRGARTSLRVGQNPSERLLRQSGGSRDRDRPLRRIAEDVHSAPTCDPQEI